MASPPGATVAFTLDHSGSLSKWVDTGTIDLAILQTTESTVRPTDMVIRPVPGERPDAVAALIDTICNELSPTQSVA